MEDFHITRVMTKNILVDFLQGVRNILGIRLKGYERLLDKGITEAMEEMKKTYNPKWYRLSINPLTHGSVMIVLYGEGEKL